MPDPNAVQVSDAYGHDVPNSQVPALTAGAVGTTAIGTVAPTAAAGAAPTVTFVGGQSCLDMYGSFTLSPVTGGGGQAAGAVVVVTPLNGFPRVPREIVCTIFDDAGGAAVACAATLVLASSFRINVGVALTTAHTYTVTYRVWL